MLTHNETFLFMGSLASLPLIGLGAFYGRAVVNNQKGYSWWVLQVALVISGLFAIYCWVLVVPAVVDRVPSELQLKMHALCSVLVKPEMMRNPLRGRFSNWRKAVNEIRSVCV